MNKIHLGVNIDHIATLRQARGTQYPEPVHAAAICENAGADGITVHLREDRRHIQDRDVYLLSNTLQTRMNLEMAVTTEMLDIACEIKPTFVCLVPESREELTTEGGLDVVTHQARISEAVSRLNAEGIKVSLFVDADHQQIDAAHASGAPYIEIHTGHYADAWDEKEQMAELDTIIAAAKYADDLGLVVNAGHGLHYHNTAAIAAIPQIYELNIGHAIIARAAIDGLDKAVRDMRAILDTARTSLVPVQKGQSRSLASAVQE